MRSWKELGVSQQNYVIPVYNFAQPDIWFYTAARRGGQGFSAFVQQPKKLALFEIFAALSLSTFQDASLRHSLLTIQPVDQGVDPAPDCTATHLPRPWSLGGFFDTPNIMPNIYTQLMGGFTVCDWAGNITGSTDPLFDIEFSPQTKN